MPAPESADYHEGDRAGFLRRHERIAKQAALDPGKLRYLGPLLGKRVADTRNLRLAWDCLAEYGGAAPGPNGTRFTDFGRFSSWEATRTLSDILKDGSYRTATARKVKIPKQHGSGERTLALLNVEDRVIHRAILQIIQPVLDPSFVSTSFGFRPGLNRQHALAKALELTRQGWKYWIVEDIRDAFDMVPRTRLLDIVRKRLPGAGDVRRQIEGALHNKSRRGIPQGSPLSPLLLNLFLDHYLDKVWTRQNPDTPLLRTADDLLVMCRSQAEAEEAYAKLRSLLTPAGMPLKGQQETAISLLSEQSPATWLGYSVYLNKQQPVVRIGEHSWSSLEANLAGLHANAFAPLRAPQVMKGWMTQQGACFQHEDKDRVTNRVREIAQQQSFEEIPSDGDLRQDWQLAYARWCELSKRQSVSAVV